MWERNFGSPVVATYVMEASSLVRVPLMSLGVETMHNLLDTLTTPGVPVAFFQKVKLLATIGKSVRFSCKSSERVDYINDYRSLRHS